MQEITFTNLFKFIIKNKTEIDLELFIIGRKLYLILFIKGNGVIYSKLLDKLLFLSLDNLYWFSNYQELYTFSDFIIDDKNWCNIILIG